MQKENLEGRIFSMNANPGGKSAPHGFIKDGEENEYYFQVLFIKKTRSETFYLAEEMPDRLDRGYKSS